MFAELNAVLKDRTDDVVFIELKTTEALGQYGENLPQGMPVPFMTRDMVSKVSGGQGADIALPSIMEAMVHIIGIDTEFKYKKEYMKFLKSIDSDFETRILKDALALAHAEDKINAMIRLRAYLSFDEDNLDALYNFGRLCEDIAAEKKDEERRYNLFMEFAKRAFEKCMDIDDTFSLAAYHLGFHYVNAQAYGLAEKIWEKAMRTEHLSDDQKIEVINTLRNLDAKLEYERGYKLVIEGFADEGLELLVPLLEDYPEWWNLQFFVGLAYRQKEMYEEALLHYKQSLQLNTGHVETMNELGICYMTMGQYEEAELYFKEALKAHPENHEILCNLGIVHIQRGEYDDAFTKIKKSLEIEPTDEIALAWMRHLENIQNT